MPQGVPKASELPNSPWGFWVADEGFPLASGPPFPPPTEPQEESPLSWGEAVEFGGVEVIVALVVVVEVVVVFILIVLFGPLVSVLRLESCEPPFPLLLLPNTLLLAVPLVTSVSSIILLLSGAAMPPQPSKGHCWGAIPSLELIP